MVRGWILAIVLLLQITSVALSDDFILPKIPSSPFDGNIHIISGDLSVGGLLGFRYPWCSSSYLLPLPSSGTFKSRIFTTLTVDPSEAQTGNDITITLKTSAIMTQSPLVTVNKHPARFVSSSGATYLYSYTVRTDDPNGPAAIRVTDAKTKGLAALLTDNQALTVTAVPVSIGTVSDNKSSYPGGVVPLFEKYELSFNLPEAGTEFVDFNPFNPDPDTHITSDDYYNMPGIDVNAIFTLPDGTDITHPAFWYGPGSWKVRFAPTLPGLWHVKVTARNAQSNWASAVIAFEVGSVPVTHGFILVDQQDAAHRFFRFSDGTQYHPIGCDLSGYGGQFGPAWSAAFPRMNQYRANYSRVFLTSLNIEPYCVGTDKANPKSLNLYDMTRAGLIDEVLDTAHANNIFVQWVIDDQTYLKDNSSQYIAATGRAAPCTSQSDFFVNAAAKQIYKRKLRYWLARWGYSANLMALELINEVAGDNSCAAWHNEMCTFVHSFATQPHLVSSSNGSSEMRASGGISWSNSSVDFVNYHDYARYTDYWIGMKSDYQLEKLGSTIQYPWVDGAVWVDRLARLAYKRYQWNKPTLWSELGLIYHTDGTGFYDWTAAYTNDPAGRHLKDALWTGALAGCPVSHWKLDYLLGTYGGGEKFWLYGPLANFMDGEDLSSMAQETTYPVSDPLNPSPHLVCSNPQMMVVAMHDSDNALLYVKNLTNVWFSCMSPYDTTYVDAGLVPTSVIQSGMITISGLDEGIYMVQQWSTTEPDVSQQIISEETITVSSSGVAMIDIDGLEGDIAVKIKRL